MTDSKSIRIYDLELAVIDAKPDADWLVDLPMGYLGEDRSARRYGMVIRTDHGGDDEVNVQIERFLAPLSVLVDVLRKTRCILRVGVFSPAVFPSLVLESETYRRIDAFGASIEISVYPETRQSSRVD